jgi:hypothetical protein
MTDAIDPIRNANDLRAISPTSNIDSAPPVPAALIAPATTASINKSKHVVDHCRAENDARFTRAKFAEIFENTRRDADTGRAESCADEDVGQPRFVGYEISRNAQPRKNGAITPSTATSNDDQPTSIISFRSDSSPTSNSRMITPNSASAAIVSICLQ